MNSSSTTHSVLAEVCEEITPKLNPNIMRGLSTVILSQVEDYIRTVAKRNFHQCVPGLEFIELVRCTPEEEYNETTRNRNRRVFDFAESYINMYRLRLGLWVDGKLQPFTDKYIYLPYVTDGGLIKLSGSLYHIKPMLTNKVISPGHKSLFVRVLGSKKFFYRSGYSIKINGDVETTSVVHATIYEAKDSSKKTDAIAPRTKAVSCMMHYLLLKYGYTGAFKKYAGVVPVIGTDEDITVGNYPPEEWDIISTAHTSVKPKGVTEAVYESTKIRLAIKKADRTPAITSLISEFFYVVDHFPSMVHVKTVDNLDVWILLMGYILVGGQFSPGRIFSQMNEHLQTLDDFVDEYAIEKLAEKGHDIRDFYDLVAMLTMCYPELLGENDRAGNVYEKYYDVMYSTLRKVTYALTNTRFALQQVAKRGVRPVYQEGSDGAMYSRLNQVLLRRLNPGAIFGLTNDETVREHVSYCGDLWFPRITAKVSEQERAAASKSGGGRGTGEMDHLDASMIEGGSILFLPKSDPTPIANFNPYVNIDISTGSIIPNPELKDLLERTREKLDDK